MIQKIMRKCFTELKANPTYPSHVRLALQTLFSSIICCQNKTCEKSIKNMALQIKENNRQNVIRHLQLSHLRAHIALSQSSLF